MSKNGVFGTNGFNDEQKQLAAFLGNDDGALAVRLRHKLVSSRNTASNGDVSLAIQVPHTLKDETQIRDWASAFFKEAFPGQEKNIAVDAVPTKEGELIGVQLKAEAASRYRSMMVNLDHAEGSMGHGDSIRL